MKQINQERDGLSSAEARKDRKDIENLAVVIEEAHKTKVAEAQKQKQQLLLYEKVESLLF
jgi:hypothetical protein